MTSPNHGASALRIRSARWSLRCAVACVFFTVAISSSAPAQQGAITSLSAGLNPAQAARAENLGKNLKCMCGGCDMASGMCTHSGGNFAGPCDSAKAELKEISDRVSKGESDEQVQQGFVQEYGPTVVIEPPKKGFDLLVWVMPVILPVIAVLFVWGLVHRWKERAAVAPVAAGGAPIDPELLARAHREMDSHDD